MYRLCAIVLFWLKKHNIYVIKLASGKGSIRVGFVLLRDGGRRANCRNLMCLRPNCVSAKVQYVSVRHIL